MAETRIATIAKGGRLAAAAVLWLPLPGRFRKVGIACVAIALVVGSALGTYARNVVWADPLRFWHDQIEKSPRVARGYTNLGRYLVEAEDYAAAREAFQVALALEGKTNEVLLNLATLSYREGDRSAARRFFTEAIELKDDDYARAYRGRAHLSLEEGLLEQAEADALEALKLRDTDPESWHILALARLFRGEEDGATEAALRSVRYGPADGKYWNALAAAYYKKRSYPEAIRAFERAVSLAPENSEFRTNLEKVSAEFRATTGGN